jgi:hypothetical protein
MSVWKDLTDFYSRAKPDKNNDHQLKTSGPRQNHDSREGSILLSTGPVKGSFVFRYLMALSPIFLVIVCIFTKKSLDNIFGVATSPLISAVPDYSSLITSVTNITILMIAPVGLFILFALIGWAGRITELWTGSVLTLGLSCATGIVLANFAESPAISGNYLLLLLQWISFLVQPFCVIAAVIVIFATEKFRRSIRYTITTDGLWIRGGLWRIHEHMIPDHQIGGTVFKQDFIGKKYNFGTVIPQIITRSGAEDCFRCTGAPEQKDKSGKGIGFAYGQKEASREPLDGLYGIPDPQNAQKILTEVIHREAMREKEEILLLNTRNRTGVQGIRSGESGIHPKVSPVVRGFDIKDDNPNTPGEGIYMEEKNPAPQESPIIRVNDYDFPETSINPAGSLIREIPPYKKPQSNQKPGTAPVQSNPDCESIFDQIKKLAELRDSGIITEQEFTTKKTELLKRI